MLRSVRIRNFRCLRDVTLVLEPLTALVGANGAGKSSVLAALQPSLSFGVRDHWRRVNDHVQIEFDLGAGQRFGRGDGSTGGFVAQFFRLAPDMLRQANQVAEERLLDASGVNLTNVFATLTRQQQQEVVDRYVELVPMFADIDARPSQGGQHRLVFQDRWKKDLWYEPGEISDGSILTLAFLLLEYQQPAPAIILIEEPERGLHPYLVGKVIDLLRQLARGALGSTAIQVVMATHSADLLEWLQPQEVRFLSRVESDGSTQIESAPTGTKEWAEALREYEGSLGKLWLSGSLGGVPGG